MRLRNIASPSPLPAHAIVFRRRIEKPVNGVGDCKIMYSSGWNFHRIREEKKKTTRTRWDIDVHYTWTNDLYLQCIICIHMRHIYSEIRHPICVLCVCQSNMLRQSKTIGRYQKVKNAFANRISCYMMLGVVLEPGSRRVRNMCVALALPRILRRQQLPESNAADARQAQRTSEHNSIRQLQRPCQQLFPLVEMKKTMQGMGQTDTATHPRQLLSWPPSPTHTHTHTLSRMDRKNIFNQNTNVSLSFSYIEVHFPTEHDRTAHPSVAVVRMCQCVVCVCVSFRPKWT